MTRFTTALFALALVACEPASGTPEPAFGCQENSRQVIDDLTAQRGDFVPAEVLDSGLGDFAGDLTRQDALLDTLSIQLIQSGDAEWVEYSTNNDPSGTDIAMDCPPAMQVPVTLTLEGSELAEVISGTLMATSASEITLFASADGFNLNGTATPLTLDTTTLDALDLQVSADLVNDGWEGNVGFAGEATEGQGDEATVSLTFDPWADFTASR